MLHRYDEWMLDLKKDKLLNLETFHSLMVDYNILPDTFHGIDLIILRVLNQIYFSECAPSNELQNFKIIKLKL